MDTQPVFGFHEVLGRIIGDVVKAVCDGTGLTEQQICDRAQVLAHSIMAFLPADAVEAILAGRCVMFHELTIDSLNRAQRDGDNPALRAARGSVVALDRAFGNNLTRLERYRKGRADADAAARKTIAAKEAAQAVGETDIADRVRRHRASRAGTQDTPVPASGLSAGDTRAVEPPIAAPNANVSGGPKGEDDVRARNSEGNAARFETPNLSAHCVTRSLSDAELRCSSVREPRHPALASS